MSILGSKMRDVTAFAPETGCAQNTTASAIWHITKPLSGLRALPAIVRDRERRVSSIALLLARSAGANPKISPVKIAVRLQKGRHANPSGCHRRGAADQARSE